GGVTRSSIDAGGRSTSRDGRHVVGAPVDTANNVVSRVGDVNKVGVRSNSSGASKLTFLAEGICPTLFPRADYVGQCGLEVCNDDAVMASIGNEDSAPFVVDTDLRWL